MDLINRRTVKSTNCDSFANGNEGCGVSGARTGSYGKSFNQNGGGWYAIERTQSFIKIFFWPRNSTPPEDVLNGGSAVNTDGWGIPAALFPKTSTCDINAKFGENNIIINLTLCTHLHHNHVRPNLNPQVVIGPDKPACSMLLAARETVSVRLPP
jgi:hypothetical protein